MKVQITWTCCHCGQLFHTRSLMYAHIHSDHPKQLYKCELCREQFSTVKAYQRHQAASHSKLKRCVWTCGWCDVVFQSRRQLEAHKAQSHASERSHGIKPHGGNCKYCGKFYQYKAQLTGHERRCSLNLNRIEWKTHPQSLETRTKISQSAKQNKSSGGVRTGAGRGKKGWYKGYWCDSSWELAFVIYQLEHNIVFARNTASFDYIYKGKWHKYFPDFIIDKTYYEIKGYKSAQWNAKVEQFPVNTPLEILDKITIQPYLQYAINKYGKDFVNLYESSDRR